MQDGINALMVAFQYQLDLILRRAQEREDRFEKALEEITLLTRKEAAAKMRISLASLDRLVKRKEISATYVDAHPRFRLGEIVRFLEARTAPARRKSRRSSG
jgi:hypothetical protein